MLRFGDEPYLECSSKGDKRFSAFYARLKEPSAYEGKSIEELYQYCKVFEDGVTGLDWKEAKGKVPVNVEEARMFYSYLWDQYFKQHPELLDIIKEYNGFTDIYGQEGHACQAEEVYRIRNKERIVDV